MLQSRVNSYEIIHLPVHYVKMCHQGQRHNPEEQILLQCQLWICGELCNAEQDSWCFSTRICCPYDWLPSLIIFSVRFSLLLGIVLVFTDICMKCGLMLVFGLGHMLYSHLFCVHASLGHWDVVLSITE